MTAVDAAPTTDLTMHAGAAPADLEVLRTSFVRVALVRVASTIAFVVMSVLVLVGLWAAGVKVFGLDSFGTKTPTDIWRFLLSGPGADQHRTLMWDALDVTIKHALTGYVIGTTIGLVLAAAFVYLPRLERVTMPIILLTQTVPILAILPLFILLFGRGMMVTSVITTICVFFRRSCSCPRACGRRSTPRSTTSRAATRRLVRCCSSSGSRAPCRASSSRRAWPCRGRCSAPWSPNGWRRATASATSW